MKNPHLRCKFVILFELAILSTLVSWPLSEFAQAANPHPAAPVAAPSLAAFPGSSLAFEPNQGQWPQRALYSASGHGFQLSLERDRARFAFSALSDGTETAGLELELSILDANGNVQVSPAGLEQGVSNYIPTADRATWRLNVPHYGRVTYSDIYPAIDLSFYGHDRALEYDFRVKAGAESERIQIRIAGTRSAQIGKTGDLELALDHGAIEFLKPVAYQIGKDGRRAAVPVDYRLAKKGSEWQLSFAVGAHDASRDLIIDPVLSYGEQLPSVTSNIGAIAADAAGDVYIAGQSQTRGFYIEKFNSSGVSVFSTVIGSGGPNAYPTGIAVDTNGNSYVTGYAATGLPATAGAYLNYTGKHNVAFVAKLASNGTTVDYLSYIGGSGYDYSSGIALDKSNSVYITGYESSADFPTTPGVYLGTNPNPGYYAAFIAKFNPAASGAASLVYSTIVDAVNVQSYGSSVAVDGSGDAYIAVLANQGYPLTSGAYNYAGLVSDANTEGAFVTKVNPTASALLYSAYLGPGTANAVAVDGNGNAYVTGTVLAEDFPTSAGAYQTSYPGGFVTELNAGGSSLVYSTFLSGPSGAFSPAGVSVTPQQIVIPAGCASGCSTYIAGYTTAVDFPAINAVQSAIGGNPSAFVVELAGNGASATYSTYFGGILSSVTSPFSASLFPTPSVAIDGAGNAYLAANTYGTDFPTTLPIPAQVNYGYIAKIGIAAGGSIVPDPIALDFDNYNTSGEAVDVSSTLTGVPVPLVLRNMGSAPVAISSIAFSPSTEFSETDACADSIPAGGTCTLNLALTPVAAGKRTATLSIASNAITSPVTVALSGTAYAAGYLQSSVSQLNFGDEALGAASTQQMVTVTNIGKTLVNLSPITASGLGGTKGNGADFQVLDNCPAQLLAGASCTVGVTFAPLATGLRGASIVLQGDGFGNQTIYLYGTGINGTSDGTIALSATTLNFNTQLVGTLSPQQSLVLLNTSVSPITISSVTINTIGDAGTGGFTITGGNCVNTAVIQVVPQSSCQINVKFEPTVAASEKGTITINDSATGGPHTVALTGIGLAALQALEFSPGNLVFPDQPVGVPSAVQNFYVYNTSTAPVTVGRVLLSGDFQVAGSTCPGATLKPGPAPGVDYNFSPECNVRITFTPTATGTRTGTLTFVDSVSGNPQVLGLTGNGIAATGTVFYEPSSLVFGKQAQGTTSATQHVAITNPGNSPVQINNITTTGNYAIVNVCGGGAYPYSLRAQGTCGVDLSFTPTSVTNPNNGSLVVTNSAGSTSLPITGTGIAAVNAVGITPTSLNFGTIQTGVGSFNYNVFFRNTGTETVTLVSGAASGDYSFSGGTCGFSSNLLAPGASCYVQVSLTPTAAGTRTGTLTLTSSAGTTTAALTGVGSAAVPATLISPNGIAFDQVAVGQSALSNVYVTFRNNGAAALNIKTAKISAGGNAFLIPMGTDACTGSTVNPNGGSCSVQVGFSPTAAGYLTGTLTFTDGKAKTYSASLAGYAPAVAISAYLDPAALSFPGQVLTTWSNSQTINLVNSSDVPLTVGTLSGTNTSAGSGTTGAFSVNSNGGYDSCSGAVVAARSKCSVSVVFGPATAGSNTGTLVFPVTYANNSTGSFTADLTGQGIAIKDSAELAPTGLNFADQAIKAVPGAGADAPQTITLYNTANLPITLGAVTGVNTAIGAATLGDFTAASSYGGYDGCSNQVIAPGSSCPVVIAFNPAVTGVRTGSLSFPVTYSDKTTTTLKATLSGKGIADGSKILVSPASGQFDVQLLNTTSDSSEVLTFNLTDIGNQPIEFKQAIVTTDFAFVSDSCSGTTLGITQSCSIVLSFTPRTLGTTAGTLTIPDSAAGSPQHVSLTGVGIAASQQIVLSQASVNFGSQVVGTKSGAITVLVSNQSAVSVPISSVAVSGTNASDFIESDSCAGGSLGGHATCAINLQFSPAASSLGLRQATVTETDTATGSPRKIALSGTGIASAPAVTLYPASLNFGSQSLNTRSAPLTFSVTNTGTTNLTVTSISSSNPTEFKLVSETCKAAPIAPQTNCLVGVVFEPDAGSTQTGNILIKDNATGSPQSVAVSGLSVGIPQGTLKPTSLTFASQNVGSPSTAQVITLSNPGTDTLKIAGIAFTGTNPGDFSQTNTCGTSIVAGANCAISVTFEPAAVGSRTATLTVTDNAENTAGSTQTATVTGTGAGVPKVYLSKTNLTFAATDVGASSTQMITLSNPGTAALDLSGISIAPTGNFTETNTCGTSVEIAGSCTISVTFGPTVAGNPLKATLSVADDAAASPQTVALSGDGIGVAKVSLSTSAINFGNQAVGIASAAMPVTVTNIGSGSLTVASFKVSGTNPADFTATSTTCSAALAPEADCVINVVFKPGSNAVYAAMLVLTDNTGNVAGSTQTVMLGGSGIGTPAATLSVPSIAFGSQSVGVASAAGSVTLADTGNGPLTITSIAITGANAGDFLEFNDCPASSSTLAVHGTCQLAVVFTPKGAGTRSASLVLTDNAGGSAGAQQKVALTGTGTGAPQATLSAAKLTFATTKVGSLSSGESVTLTNTGNVSLSVASVTVGGANAGDFSAFNSCAATVDAVDTCMVVVFFKPAATGKRTGTITITDNANNVPGATQVIQLNGTGD